MCRDRDTITLLLLVCATYTWVLSAILCAHPVPAELHIQHHANREVATADHL